MHEPHFNKYTNSFFNDSNKITLYPNLFVHLQLKDICFQVLCINKASKSVHMHNLAPRLLLVLG